MQIIFWSVVGIGVFTAISYFCTLLFGIGFLELLVDLILTILSSTDFSGDD